MNVVKQFVLDQTLLAFFPTVLLEIALSGLEEKLRSGCGKMLMSSTLHCIKCGQALLILIADENGMLDQNAK